MSCQRDRVFAHTLRTRTCTAAYAWDRHVTAINVNKFRWWSMATRESLCVPRWNSRQLLRCCAIQPEHATLWCTNRRVLRLRNTNLGQLQYGRLTAVTITADVIVSNRGTNAFETLSCVPGTQMHESSNRSCMIKYYRAVKFCSVRCRCPGTKVPSPGRATVWSLVTPCNNHRGKKISVGESTTCGSPATVSMLPDADTVNATTVFP